MTILKCGVTNCVNFEEDLCALCKVDIAGSSAHAPEDIYCSSFAHKSKSIAYIKKCLQLETDVSCNACCCAFNNQLTCSSPSIFIGGDGACDSVQTCCETFKSKMVP